mmetsp:Transcript_7332/g.16682  ORF Transcript_7332/g.16682 Transcript_7332/m.16682 type:complete len:201 (+) Transcript_7332:56-658(+)
MHPHARPHMQQLAIAAAALAALQALPIALGQASCPRQPQFERWLLEFQRICNPPAGDPNTNATWSVVREPWYEGPVEGTCRWVTCPCLEVTLQVPVSLDDLQLCFEEGTTQSYITLAQRRLAAELIRGTACRDRTRLMGKACGECDRYADERPECVNRTLGPIRIFTISDHTFTTWGTNRATLSLGMPSLLLLWAIPFLH